MNEYQEKQQAALSSLFMHIAKEQFLSIPSATNQPTTISASRCIIA